MANKLKVDELRAELAKRGLDTTGTKPSLVRRLESALEQENKLSEVHSIDGGGISNKKRERESEDGGGDSDNGTEKIKAIDKFRDMNVKQLRQQASLLGVSTTGTKRQLIDRLCNAEPDNHHSLQPIEEQEQGEKEKEKIVTATKKGSAVLDQFLSDQIKSEYHVLQIGDDVYDAMLNQTYVGDNNNKFYVIQLLESDDGGRFMVYNRWGRVGVNGQVKLFGPYTSRDPAISEFEQKFYAKTKNHWSERKEFKCYSKCYAWLEMDYSEQEKDPVVKEKPDSAIAIQPRETQLESRVAKFISLICNVSMMKQQMMEIGYNANKLPLGKLSKSTILKGYDVLKRISDVIGTADRLKLEQLSGEFYTVIPHDFGFKKMREFVIDTPQKLKFKLEMVEALGEIEVATKLLEDEPGMQEDPLYSHYKRLHCELTPVEVDSEEFTMIAMYLQNTHAKTHSQYTVDIAQIFKISREEENERFRKFSNTKNRMLLWHGSRLTNWTGILSQGLRIAPPEAPVTGYMFGKGVYFADMFSKSANYCYANNAVPAGVLLLCEVALGDMAELSYANYDADKLPSGKLSTKGVGKTAPDLSDAKALEDGVVVPLGKPKEQQGTKGSLLYNEYIVYSVDQIRMRYVVQVNFNYKH
ncbi:DNA LIGASE [Salix purpurea]|uniref:Poly [ADP-ribose] polymerase n=1 Tax=Salix purpurea TaxID=77065 RepID=A0A9Q0SJX3_SALPP|nr:DNA LIGASE [Salix purpurea]